MKKYICLNHGECNWADEIPPREFSPDQAELNCPNCGSANIRAAEKPEPRVKRFLPFIAGAILLLGAILYFWLKGSEIQKPPGVPPVEPPITATTTLDDGGRHTSTTTGDKVDSTTDTPVQKDPPSNDPPHEETKSITWTMVEGSGFCDPSLDGTYLYTERNNLGQERERKVLNKAGCYPANN